MGSTARGIRLSHAAYESRRKRAPPEILKGHFENTDGGILQTYDAAAIKQIINQKEESTKISESLFDWARKNELTTRSK
jgi:hypothetical protein